MFAYYVMSTAMEKQAFPWTIRVMLSGTAPPEGNPSEEEATCDPAFWVKLWQRWTDENTKILCNTV